MHVQMMGLVLDQILVKTASGYSTDEVFFRFVEAVAEEMRMTVQLCTRVRHAVDGRQPYELSAERFRVLELPWHDNLGSFFTRSPILVPMTRRAISRAMSAWALVIACGVHPNSVLALRLAQRRRVPRLFWVRGDIEADIRHRWSGLNRRLGLLLAKFLSASIPRGTPTVSMGRGDYPFLKRLGPVHIGYSSKFEDEDVQDRPRPLPRVRNRILYVGRISPEKGIETLLDAMRRVVTDREDLKPTLTIVGDDFQGSRYGPMLRQSVERGTDARHVKFVGHVPFGPDLFSLYDAHDVVVVPSRTEGFPQVVFEAMARGTPVIATRVGGIPSVVEDRLSGLLIPPDDAEAMATAIEAVLTDDRLWEDLSRSGIVIARKHTRSREVRSVAKFLHERNARFEP